jgi:hypothetical protein
VTPGSRAPLLSSLLLLGVAAPARADPFHAQTLPLGQRAIGMGGAFTAIATDPSATYYNPAGIVMGGASALSASLTLTAFDRSTVESGYRTENGHSTLDHNAAASLPVFVSALTQLGRRDDEGVRRHAIALSTFTVNQRRLSFDVEVRRASLSSDQLETLTIENADRTIWHALSYAFRYNKRLALGVSGVLSIERARYNEERIAATLDEANMDGSFDSRASTWSSNRVSVSVKNVLARIGVLYRASERLRLGVMFQPPSVHVRGEAKVRERVLDTDVIAPRSSFFNTSQTVGARGPLPWELRLGVAYALKSWLMLSVDTSLYGKTGSPRNPVAAVAPRTPDPTTGATPDVGSFYTERWYRTHNGNVALGAEAMLRESIAVRAGLYTDLSSAPPIPRVTSVYQMPDVHRVGGAFSVGLVNDGYDISIGAIGVFGRGRGLSYNTDAVDGGPMYQRTHVTDRMFLVFLNGVRSAVKALAKKTDEKLREMLAPAPGAEPDAKPEPPPERPAGQARE